MLNRYQMLFDYAALKKPKSIIEIGTNFGYSAEGMIEASGATRYVGFDLFEDATAETDAREFNAKKRPVMSQVQSFLEENTDASIRLIKGDTNQTLPEFVKTGEKFDFAFIDGGHSVETIRNDWQHVAMLMNPEGVVVFDDFYFNKDGMGCSTVIKNLPFKLFNLKVTVKKTGLELGMAVVRMKDLKGVECYGYL